MTGYFPAYGLSSKILNIKMLQYLNIFICWLLISLNKEE
jgi:hypothetical protein